MNEPIKSDDIIPREFIESIEKLADALEEVNKLTEQLKEEGIEINFEIKLR